MKEFMVFTGSGQCAGVKADCVIYDDVFDIYRFVVNSTEGQQRCVAEFNRSQVEGWVEQ